MSEQTAHKMDSFFGVGVDCLIDPKSFTLEDLRSAPEKPGSRSPPWARSGRSRGQPPCS